MPKTRQMYQKDDQIFVFTDLESKVHWKQFLKSLDRPPEINKNILVSR
jgi:hypothetical protein